MSAGELRDYVQIESSASSPSTNGDYSGNTTWSLVANVWARIIYAKVSESSGERDFTRGKATIKIRHRSDITNDMRIVFNGRIFEIEDNFDVNSKGQYLFINTVVRDDES